MDEHIKDETKEKPTGCDKWTGEVCRFHLPELLEGTTVPISNSVESMMCCNTVYPCLCGLNVRGGRYRPSTQADIVGELKKLSQRACGEGLGDICIRRDIEEIIFKFEGDK